MNLQKWINNYLLPVILVVFFVGCSKSKCSDADEMPLIKIGISNSEAPTLLYIADSLGYFKKNKLKYEITTYSSGREAANALLRKEIHISTSGDFVFINDFPKHNDLRIIGTASKLKNNFIVFSEAKKLGAPTDLMGKTIGVLKNSAPHYFLESFLFYHNISIDQIRYKFAKPQDIKQLILEDKIDCGVLWNPYIYQLDKSLNGTLTKWNLHTFNPMYYLILSTQQAIDSLNCNISAFTKSLIEAENWATNNPEKVKNLIKKKINYDENYFENEIWPNLSLRFELTQELLISIEEQFKWKSQQDSSNAPIENFNYIHYQTLDSLCPDRVTFVH